MHPIEFIALFTVFIIQVLTTRSLNQGRLAARLWRWVWAVELIFLGLILSALILGYTAFARWAMTAGVSVFLLRAAVRGYDYGVVKFAQKALPDLRAGTVGLISTIGEITTVIVGLFAEISVAFIKALPEAMADAVSTTNSKSNNWMSGLGQYNYRTQKWDNGLDPAGMYLEDND